MPQAESRRAREALIAKLRDILPRQFVLTETEQLRPYECDGLTAYRQLPWIVVLPSNGDEVEKILGVCTAHGVPVVARGAGTGLSGGALPHPHGVLLSMTRFDRILSVDRANRTARVQPGVRNIAISEEVERLGLYYAPDPSSQIACSIGGNVAENSGGVHCLKYGLTVHNILKLEVVLMSGEPVTIGADALDMPGYDLLALMTGSEGMLGVVTEITVRLLPNPAILAVEDFVHAGYPRDATALLLCELDGTESEVEVGIREVTRILQLQGATDIRVAADEAERQRFWSGRKNAFPAVGRISPDYYCIDGTIPKKRLGEVLTGISKLSNEYDLRVANVFHAGDGNLHPLILYDGSQPGEFERTEALGGKILELCIAVGGTITGEHGVGVEKLNQMCVQFETPELEQFHAIKKAFDPAALLNPGKAVPTLSRCAEFNAMHVHKGRLPFPELPRF